MGSRVNECCVENVSATVEATDTMLVLDGLLLCGLEGARRALSIS